MKEKPSFGKSFFTMYFTDGIKNRDEIKNIATLINRIMKNSEHISFDEFYKRIELISEIKI